MAAARAWSCSVLASVKADAADITVEVTMAWYSCSVQVYERCSWHIPNYVWVVQLHHKLHFICHYLRSRRVMLNHLQAQTAAAAAVAVHAAARSAVALLACNPLLLPAARNMPHLQQLLGHTACNNSFICALLSEARWRCPPTLTATSKPAHLALNTRANEPAPSSGPAAGAGGSSALLITPSRLSAPTQCALSAAVSQQMHDDCVDKSNSAET